VGGIRRVEGRIAVHLEQLVVELRVAATRVSSIGPDFAFFPVDPGPGSP
jgi:hypothetical protein